MSDANPSPNGAGRESGASLLRGVREGRKEAWDRLVALCAPLVYTWCRRAGLPEADAIAVGEEVFRAVARQAGDFRRDRDGPFRAWLWSSARRAIDDHPCRRQAEAADGGSQAETHTQRPPPADSRGAGPDVDREEAALLYRQAVELIRGEFPEDVWRAFWAVAVEGRPPAEAAQALGMTCKAVYLARARVRVRLHSEFADLLET